LQLSQARRYGSMGLSFLEAAGPGH